MWTRNCSSLLKRSGCWQVNFGIESGDPEILKKHRKFYELDEVGRKLRMVKDAGMRVKGLFMIGLPGENEAAIRRTIDYALSLPLDEINVTKFTPFPGAPVYRTIREFGEFNENWPLMNCMNFVFVPHGMTREQLEETVQRVHQPLLPPDAHPLGLHQDALEIAPQHRRVPAQPAGDPAGSR